MPFPISLGSGATLASHLINGEHRQLIAPVTVNPLPAGSSFIGLVTQVPGAVTPVSDNSGSLTVDWVSGSTVAVSNLPNVTLNSSSNFIGLVTTVPGAVTPVSDNSESLTVDWISGSTVGVSSLPALPTGSNFIGLVTVSNTIPVTQSGTWNVGINGLVSLASGTFVSLNSGNNNIGDVDVASLPATPAGSNFIGLVSAASIHGKVDIVSALPAGGNFIGLATVTITNTINVGQTTLFPSPNQIGSVTISNTPGVTQSGTWNVGLNPGSNFIGLATVTMSNSLSLGQVTLFPGPNQIGSVTVSNIVPVSQSGTWNVGVNGLLSLASGTFVSLNSGSNFIGLATVVQANQPALIAGTAYIGLASVNIGGTLPALTAGSAFVGLVSVQGNVNIQSGATVSPLPISTYTSFATVISATGNATLFTPPTSRRWILKDLLITSLGRSEVKIVSGTADVIPYAALATTGGYALNNGDSGIRAKAVDDAFVLNLNGAATISVMANVRFE